MMHYENTNSFLKNDVAGDDNGNLAGANNASGGGVDDAGGGGQIIKVYADAEMAAALQVRSIKIILLLWITLSQIKKSLFVLGGRRFLCLAE